MWNRIVKKRGSFIYLLNILRYCPHLHGQSGTPASFPQLIGRRKGGGSSTIFQASDQKWCMVLLSPSGESIGTKAHLQQGRLGNGVYLATCVSGCGSLPIEGGENGL